MQQAMKKRIPAQTFYIKTAFKKRKMKTKRNEAAPAPARTYFLPRRRNEEE
jgi:hypothetical protein